MYETQTAKAHERGTPAARPAGSGLVARLRRALTAAGVLTAALLGALLPPAAAQQPPEQRSAAPLVFENIHYFDGSALQGPATVVIEGGLITAVGESVDVPQEAELLDGSGMTLLPGLIDAHVHAFTPEMLTQALMFGVTTVYDMFTAEEFAAQMRAEQEAGGAAYRADMLSAGTLATAPGGHGTQFGITIDTLTDPAQAEAWVADRVAAGADYIKVVLETGEEMGFETPTLDERTVSAVIAAAHAQGLQVVTHVQTLAAAEMAVRAGTDGLAHMFSDAPPTAELLDAMVAGAVFVVPTLSVFQSVGVDDEVDTTLATDERVAPYLTPADLQSLANPYTGFPDLAYANARAGIELLHQAGVRVLAGTDAPNPGTAFGATMHRELELLVGAGLTPAEALAAATSVNADTFGLQDRGRIAPGMVADLLVVKGDPTTDITASRDIVTVLKRGVPADREAYRQALADAAAQAQAAAAAQAEQLQGEGPLLISDFETGEATALFGQPWAATTDEQAGGDSTATIEVVEGGAGDSGHSLQVSGVVGDQFALPWAGAMYMPGVQPFAPADLSSRPVLSFAVRGQPASYRVQLFCANTGQVPPEHVFEVTEEWQAVSVDLSTVGGCDVSGLMAVIFSAGEHGEFAFQLDDVAFVAAVTD